MPMLRLSRVARPLVAAALLPLLVVASVPGMFFAPYLLFSKKVRAWFEDGARTP